jgi:mRNA interferase HigB
MRVIARSTLVRFRDIHPDGAKARPALESWYAEARKANWTSPAAVRDQYRSASILKGSRVVFNIAGNAFRLVAKVHCRVGIVYIRFVGTHAQYDDIDAESI